jgi:hypothetical protein
MGLVGATFGRSLSLGSSMDMVIHGNVLSGRIDVLILHLLLHERNLLSVVNVSVHSLLSEAVSRTLLASQILILSLCLLMMPFELDSR